MRFAKTQTKRIQRFVPFWVSNVESRKKTPVRKPIEHKPTKEVSVMAWYENEQGEVLMVKQVKGRQSWALPGGKVKVGESLCDALKREVREETGLSVAKAVPIMMFDRHTKNNVSFLYRIEVREFKKISPEDPKEISEIIFKKRVPVNATPTLRYFFKQAKAGNIWA